ncbi:uncharacterized protein LOC125703493 [Lagopus muta]|uniref:uncharacterized protein LOC125703493 n=1 Tax=Lagopus muta TaxID=64668 RepID=UPI00209DA7F1|nr:uncharacterized protein LOC125703493 [Lagopus muta]
MCNWKGQKERDEFGAFVRYPCLHSPGRRPASGQVTALPLADAVTVSSNMVSTRRRARSNKSVATQTEGLPRCAAVQVSGCRECLSLLLPGDDGRDGTCVRCEQLDELLSLVVELREEVERLRSIRDCEREIDWWCTSLQETSRDCNPQPVVDSLPSRSKNERADLGGEEEWQHVPPQRRRRRPPRPTSVPQVPLSNRFETLELEGEEAENKVVEQPLSFAKERRSAPRLKTASSGKERRVIVVGDSLLKGTEGPICRPDPTRREVCCLPGARVRDISRKLPGLIRPSDYYPLLVVQVGSDDTAKRSLRAIKNDFKGLGRVLDGAGMQVIFSSIPSVAGKDSERIKKALLINKWLREEKDHGFEVGCESPQDETCRGCVESDAIPFQAPSGSLDEPDAVASLPTPGDILVSYSTFPGFVSWRDKVSGSWYVETLDSVLEHSARSEDLLTMLLRVSDIVSTKGKYKQIPGCFNFLRKRFFFLCK